MGATIHYKATRPDGTDFATGKTDVAAALKGKKWMPAIKGEPVMCHHGYHVSDAVAETLIGGTWPCRLFRVELKSTPKQKQQHKYVVRTYRPVAELPAHRALGPNGKTIVRLIAEIGTLTKDDWKKVDAAWDAARYAARYAALAVLTRDKITAEQYKKLAGPLAVVIPWLLEES